MQGARVDVGELLGHLEPLHQLGRRDDPAQAQSREQDLGKGAEIDHEARGIERLERRGRALAVEERAVEAVLHDGQPVPGGEVEEPAPRRSPMVSPVGLCALGWQ